MTDNETVLLDADILVSFPEILKIKSNFFKLATTTHVIQDIKSGYNIAINNKDKQKLLEKIETSKKDGIFTIFPTDVESHFIYTTNKLTTSETSLLDLAVTMKAYSNVVIGSMNENIINSARILKIKTYDLDMIIDIYARQSGQRKDDIKMKLYYNKKELISFRNKTFLGILVLLLTLFGYKNRETIFSNLNATGTIILTILFAIFLFIFRERQRISYGILELGFGLTSIIMIFSPSFALTNIPLDFSFGVKYIGGIYVMIRGLDNIVKGLSKTATGQVLRYKYKIGL